MERVGNYNFTIVIDVPINLFPFLLAVEISIFEKCQMLAMAQPKSIIDIHYLNISIWIEEKI